MDHPRAVRAERIDLTTQPPLRIGGAIVDPVSREARFAGGKERLQPQILKVLIALSRCKGQVVTRNQLIELCWDGRIVGEDVINHAISVLRTFAARATGFTIQTVPKAGYRLVETDQSFSKAWLGRFGIAAAVAVVGIGFLRIILLPNSDVRTVLIQPVHASAADQAIAHDLMVRLSSMQMADAELVRLGRASSGSLARSDLVLEVMGSPRGIKQAVALLDGEDHSVLWSRDFDGSAGNAADLSFQVAYTVARVLQCALEALPPGERYLDQPALKLYLNGCARLAESYGAGAESSIPIFSAVVERSPEFRPGWAKLLMAEASFAAESPRTEMYATFRRHIVDARKIDPGIAEATLVEVGMLPLHSYDEALRLLEKAKQQDSDNPVVLSFRAAQLRTVGRMQESIEDARRAAELDPLSPWARASYVLALAYAGRADAAENALQDLERLWPGTAIAQEVKFRFHLRFGDPQTALRMAKSLDVGGSNQERFLAARVDPTEENINRMIRLARPDPNAPAEVGGAVLLGFLVQALGQFDRNGELVKLLDSWPNQGDLRSLGDVYFRPALKGLRHDVRFMQLAGRAGLLSYWRRSGRWPDFCSEPDLPYKCPEQAERILGR